MSHFTLAEQPITSEICISFMQVSHSISWMTHIIQTENRLSDCRHSTRMPLHWTVCLTAVD